MRAVVDAFAAHVKSLEEWINHPGVFVVPVYHEIGAPKVAGGWETAMNRYGVGITRWQGRWRVIAYRWGNVRPQSRAARKPWQEAALFERVVTMEYLPELCSKLEHAAQVILARAADCEYPLNATKEAVERLQKIPVRTAEIIDAEETARRDWSAFSKTLSRCEDNTVRLSFKELGQWVPDKNTGKPAGLPPSAFKHQAWWGNDETHPQARAWLEAGFRVASADLREQRVVFERISPRNHW
jgi:hypothetical protein